MYELTLMTSSAFLETVSQALQCLLKVNAKKQQYAHLNLDTWRHLHPSISNKPQSNKVQAIIAI